MDEVSHPENSDRRQKFKLEVENGGNKLMVSWELRTGVIQVGYWSEAKGVGGSVGQRADKFKAATFAEAVQKADTVIQKFLDLDGVEVFKTGGKLFSGLFEHMKSWLPAPKGKEEASSEGKEEA